MKLLIVLAFVVTAFVATALARPDGTYDSRYDNFDVDQLISSKRLLKSYAHCFIGDGKCTPEANDFKKYVPEATKTACAKCSEKQKVLIAKTIKAIMEKLPAEFEALRKQTDPENAHEADLKAYLDKYGN